MAPAMAAAMAISPRAAVPRRGRGGIRSRRSASRNRSTPRGARTTSLGAMVGMGLLLALM